MYYYGLDAIRFIAALLVACRHLGHSDARLMDATWIGWIGVQIFFVLSGVVIANSARNASPGEFAWSRFLRLYPAGFICVSVSWVAWLAMAPAGHWHLWNYACSLLFAPGCPFVESAYWTLPVEMVFYTLVGALLLRSRFDNIGYLAIGLTAWSAIYLCVLAGRIFWLHDPPASDFGIQNVLLGRHGCFFALGIFAWLWSASSVRPGHIGWAAVALTLCLIEIVCRSFQQSQLDQISNVQFQHAAVLASLVWLTAFAGMAASLRYGDAISKLPPPVRRILRTMGLATYPLYLLHEQVGNLIIAGGVRLGISHVFSAGIALFVVIGLAVAICVGPEPQLRYEIARAAARIRELRANGRAHPESRTGI